MKYNPALDGIRALAVLAVVAYHCRLPGAGGGFIGVDMFFVLSGFLITSLLRAELLASGTISLIRFYRNRMLRLYPPLVAMLVVWAATAPFLYPGIDVARNGLVALGYLSDYVVAFGHIEGHLGHTWSLAVEEHYYMIWPFVLIATARLRTGHLALLLAGLFAAATLWRMIDFTVWGDWLATYSRFDTHMSGLVLGSLLAVLPWRKIDVSPAVGVIAIAFLAFAVSFFHWRLPAALLTGGVAVDFMAGGLVLAAAAARGAAANALSAKPLAYIGKLSYSIYLWHFPLAALLRHQLPPVVTFVIVLAASTTVAAVSYAFMEKPLQEWRHRRSGQGVPAGLVQT